MRRTGLEIMMGLLRLVKPLAHIMVLCIVLGTLGHLCAAGITVLAADLLLVAMGQSPWIFSFTAGAVLMIACAVARGLLRYGEQTCGHYIAFKLLAILRDRVFGALRRLAPAKLEGRGRGDLISLITGDIELLEVFYAHTIAPICIAVLFSGIIVLIIGSFHWLLGLVSLLSFFLVGCTLPLLSAGIGRAQGMKARDKLGDLNNYFLESLRGIRETMQFGREDERASGIVQKTDELNQLQEQVKKHEGTVSAWSGALVMLLTVGMFATGLVMELPFSSILLTTVALSASFGPTIALANLSAAMDQTLAAGERVLSLLEENPETEDVIRGETPAFTGAEISHLSFAYQSELVLHDLSASFPKGEIIAVVGKSGSGKSTMLKLLMRFWQAEKGSVLISGEDEGAIQTRHLRNMESYMIQETDLFHDSIRDNIRIGKLDATQEEIEEAAKKASLHDFIQTLPHGYDTPVGELGETLSGGERQRIGLARAFLHEAPLLLLDEPTSNLDSLNEGIVLRSLTNSGSRKTIILVSHRKSTVAVADRIYNIDNGRLS